MEDITVDPSFTHWVLFNLPGDSRELPEAIPTQGQLSNGALQGKNDFGTIGYAGPCPPAGQIHKYSFTIYGTKKPLNLNAGASKEEVLDALQLPLGGPVRGLGQTVGTYGR